MAKKKIKSSKLAKNSKEYKDLDYKQSRLKSALHENWRQLYKHKSNKLKGKAPFTMKELENQQIAINEIREQIGRQPITLFQSFQKTLKNLTSD